MEATLTSLHLRILSSHRASATVQVPFADSTARDRLARLAPTTLQLVAQITSGFWAAPRIFLRSSVERLGVERLAALGVEQVVGQDAAPLAAVGAGVGAEQLVGLGAAVVAAVVAAVGAEQLVALGAAPLAAVGAGVGAEQLVALGSVVLTTIGTSK